jgi:fluoroquinolone resistance protein
LAKVVNTAFREVEFKECKILGVQFGDCNKFGLAFSFEKCQLNNAGFVALKIRHTKFKNCSLEETDFSDADLTEAVFDQCVLFDAIFDNTNLEKADLRTAKNFNIDPEKNRIRKAQFSINGLAGLLEKFNIVIEQ